MGTVKITRALGCDFPGQRRGEHRVGAIEHAQLHRLVRTGRTLTESQSAVLRRNDSGGGDSGTLRTGVGRSHDRRGRDSAAMGGGGVEARRRGRRLLAAAEVRTAGWGGLAVVSKITGLARSTINRGEDDLDAEPLPKGRGD